LQGLPKVFLCCEDSLAVAEHGRRHGQHAECGAGDEKASSISTSGAAQFVAEEKVQVDFLRVLQREAEKQDEQDKSRGWRRISSGGPGMGDAKAVISARLFQN
jgi:hypothetical protein